MRVISIIICMSWMHQSFTQSTSYFKLFNNSELKFEFVGKIFEYNDSLLLFSTAKKLNQNYNSVIRLQNSPLNKDEFSKYFQSNALVNISYSIYDAEGINTNFYLTGSYQKGAGLENYDFFISKFSKPSFIETKIFGKSNSFESARSIVSDFDNSLIICGLSRKENTVNINESLIIKLDTNLNIIWQRKLTTELGNLAAQSVTCDNDNNIYVFADEYSLTSGQAVIIKLNSDGDSIWTKKYPGSSSLPKDIHYNKKGNLIASVTADYDGKGRNFTFMELDTSGTVLWTRSYLEEIGDAVFAEKFIELRNGGYAVSLNNGYQVLLVVDENGEPTNIQHFEGYPAKEVKDIIELSDGSFAIAGNYYNLTDPTDKNTMWLIKTNEKGELTTSSLDEDFPKAIIYPNPTTGLVIIENVIYEQVHIVNNNGDYLGSFKREDQVDISKFDTGLYLLLFETPKGIYSQKIIKQ